MINYSVNQKISFWLPFLFNTRGFRATHGPYSTMFFWLRGSKRFFSDVINFKDGRGNFTVDFEPLRFYSASGMTLAVLHFDSYFGFGKFWLRFFRLGGNLMVFSKGSSI